jgi:hypothetical protein
MSINRRDIHQYQSWIDIKRENNFWLNKKNYLILHFPLIPIGRKMWKILIFCFVVLLSRYIFEQRNKEPSFKIYDVIIVGSGV